MKRIPSPNFSARATGISLDYIVIHYTGMKDAASALARLCDPASSVSAHFMIDEDGSLTQLVDEENRAWHAGKSFWRGITDLNSASIGIELVNPGHEFGYRPFPPDQVAALKDLLKRLIKDHNLSPRKAILGHSDIAPSRKQDPGELFPWQDLAKEGLGLWPEAQAQDFGAASEGEVTDLLAAIGYETTSFSEALLAFQRHYYTQELTGKADAETVARIRALKRLSV